MNVYAKKEYMMESEKGMVVGVREWIRMTTTTTELKCTFDKLKKIQLKGSAFELLCGDTNKRNEMAKEPFELWIEN